MLTRFPRVAITLTAALALQFVFSDGWLSSRAIAQVQPRQTQQEIQSTQGGSLDRTDLAYLLQLSGGMNPYGQFHTPVPVSSFYEAQTLEDGWYQHPMIWDPQNSILLQVFNGHIIRLEYQLQGGV